MALIDIRDLTFAYPGSYDNVFEHLSLQLDTRWRLGLVGRNGRGKTTLLRLLQRQYEYDGAISVPVPLDCFPSPVSAPERDTLTILEEQEPGLELWRIYKELDTLEVDAGVLFRPYSSLSGGEQVKVLLAALFLREGAFLLLDEPTNHLDLEGRRVVSRYLSRKSGFLLVSHDRAFLDGCVDHIMVINKRDIEVRQGSFSAWWRDKQARDDWERAENARLKREIGRLEDAARRTASWSDRVEAAKNGLPQLRTSPRPRLSRPQGAKDDEALQGRGGPPDGGGGGQGRASEEHRTGRGAEAPPPGAPQALSAGGQGVGTRLRGGARVPSCLLHCGAGVTGALVGRNGSGKSSLLRLALGEEIPHTGLFSLASGLVVSYVPRTPPSCAAA